MRRHISGHHRAGCYDGAVADFFDGTVPPEFEARRAALLAGKPLDCDLLVDRVDLRILRGGSAIRTLRVTRPNGC